MLSLSFDSIGPSRSRGHDGAGLKTGVESRALLTPITPVRPTPRLGQGLGLEAGGSAVSTMSGTMGQAPRVDLFGAANCNSYIGADDVSRTTKTTIISAVTPARDAVIAPVASDVNPLVNGDFATDSHSAVYQQRQQQKSLYTSPLYSTLRPPSATAAGAFHAACKSPTQTVTVTSVSVTTSAGNASADSLVSSNAASNVNGSVSSGTATVGVAGAGMGFGHSLGDFTTSNGFGGTSLSSSHNNVTGSGMLSSGSLGNAGAISGELYCRSEFAGGLGISPTFSAASPAFGSVSSSFSAFSPTTTAVTTMNEAPRLQSRPNDPGLTFGGISPSLNAISVGTAGSRAGIGGVGGLGGSSLRNTPAAAGLRDPSFVPPPTPGTMSWGTTTTEMATVGTEDDGASVETVLRLGSHTTATPKSASVSAKDRYDA